MLIFLLQSVWLYISELAGKDLDISIIIKFLSYVSPRLVILILPLTILLSSIMVFGNFAENYEFAAMKSTGISLQRAMRSLSIFILFVAILTFFFSNNINPVAEYNFHNLRKNISKVKPTMAIITILNGMMYFFICNFLKPLAGYFSKTLLRGIFFYFDEINTK